MLVDSLYAGIESFEIRSPALKAGWKPSSHEINTALEEKLFEKSKLIGEIILNGRTNSKKVYST